MLAPSPPLASIRLEVLSIIDLFAMARLANRMLTRTDVGGPSLVLLSAGSVFLIPAAVSIALESAAVSFVV
jgi:hypothetical protein